MLTALLAALVSATVTLAIFAFGRWHEYRSKQTDYLKAKLEEFVNSLETINENCSIIDLETLDGADLLNAAGEKSRRLIHGMNKPSMLANLYFPSLLGRVQELGSWVIKYNEWMTFIGKPGLPAKFDDDGEIMFQGVRASLADVVKEVYDRQPYLTKRIGYGD